MDDLKDTKVIHAPPPLGRHHRAALDAAVSALSWGTAVGTPDEMQKRQETVDLARQALWLLNHGASFKREPK
jgi:hypothetical protein